MKARKRSATARKGSKARRAKPIRWAEGYPFPSAWWFDEPYRTKTAVHSRTVLAEHRRLFEAVDHKGDNLTLRWLLAGLRIEAEEGNALAAGALRFLARESLRMLEDLGRAEDVVDLARGAAGWFLRWAGENPDAARKAVEWELTVPVNVPGPKSRAEWEAAREFVGGLNIGSAQPSFVRRTVPRSQRLGVASLARPIMWWLRLVLALRESGSKPEADWPELSRKTAGFYAGKFCERLRRRAFRERFPELTEEFFERFDSKQKDSKGSDNSEMGGYDYVRKRVRQFIGHAVQKGI
ncbi:MAG TPA: hypothetical protein PLU30_00175 [Verrucomicrobiae bacterium]|nr:hypothetical protein [Verrucomicrobiae bacterium]